MKRVEQITFRVSESELEHIKEYAERYDMPVAEYCRRMCLIGSGESVDGLEQIEALDFLRLKSAVLAKQAQRYSELNQAVIDTTLKLEDSVQNIISVNPKDKRKKRYRDKKKE